MAAFLYGSVARGEIGPKSDIDILVLTNWQPRTLEGKLNSAAHKLTNAHYKKTGRLIRIEILVVKPTEAPTIQIWPSILKEGKLIHSKGIVFVPSRTKASNQFAIFVTNMRALETKKKVKISLRLYGRTSSYRYKGKKVTKSYEGILQAVRADILAPGCFLIPKVNEKQFEHFLQSESVPFTKKEILTI